MFVIDDNNLCNNVVKRFYCAVDPSGKKSNICKGDSGSPMMYLANGNWYVFGITGFHSTRNTNECVPEKPSFYTMVPKYIDWINVILKF